MGRKIGLENRVRDNKDILIDLMRERGVKSIHVEFNGEGDSGQIENVTVTPENKEFLQEVLEGVRISNGMRWTPKGREIIWDEKPCTIHQLVNSICYSALEQEYGGWENNDGAYGEFLFSAETRKVSLEMNTRYTEVNTESRVIS